MSSCIQQTMNNNSVWSESLTFFPNLSRFFQERPPKTHNYTKSIDGVEYVFEAIDTGKTGYMTGQGKGIKRGDYLLLKDSSELVRYQVEDIDYYWNPRDMWVALLKKVSN